MESGVSSPSNVELNLLLEWPGGRTRPQWVAIFGGSLVFHFIVFLMAIQLPSLIEGDRHPERTVVVRHIPLYLPRDVMTQRAPNRQKVTKQIDLADLMASEKAAPNRGKHRPSIRRIEIPKQAHYQEIAKNAPPQILPEAPAIATKANAAPTAGIQGGLPVGTPPPPSPTPGPFQNIGGDVAPNPHPTLTPPRGVVNTARELAPSSNSPQLSISDDARQSMPGSPGATAQVPSPHAAVELQSDPSGADFKIYLQTILTIVRANWRRVLPESARMGALRGRTVVEFIIDRDGSIPKLVTADSSGSEPLDRAAVAGLSMSNPLPPLPADFKGFQVRLAFTFAYNMPSQ